MSDISKYIGSNGPLRDPETGEVPHNPNLYGNPYRKVDKKKSSSVCNIEGN